MAITYYGDPYINSLGQIEICDLPDYISIKPGYSTIYKKFPRKKSPGYSEKEKPPQDNDSGYVLNAKGNKVYTHCKYCFYPLTIQQVHERDETCSSCTNLSTNTPNPEISSKAQHRLWNAVDWMYMLAKPKPAYNDNRKKWFKFKVSLITLSLPCKQLHDDMYIKAKMLNEFLTILRQQKGLKSYIWRAEKQFNFNIHFHLIIDIYIHYKELNRIWNNILRHHGYIDQYRTNQLAKHKNGFQFDPKQSRQWDKKKKEWVDHRTYYDQLKAYKTGMRTNWTNPVSSTDIHSMQNIENGRVYMGKYVSKKLESHRCLQEKIIEYKQEHNTDTITDATVQDIEAMVLEGLKVEGNIWYLSTNLSKLKSLTIIDENTGAPTPIMLTDEFYTFFTSLYKNNKKLIDEKDYCTVIRLPMSDIIRAGPASYSVIFTKYISHHQKNTVISDCTPQSILGIPLQIF